MRESRSRPLPEAAADEDVRLLAYGDRGVLVELADLEAAMRWAEGARRALEGGALKGLAADVVPGARTVLLVAAPGSPVSQLRGAAQLIAPAAPGGGEDDAVEIPVVYDGEDLDDVAHATGLTPDEVVAVHTGQTWTVAFGGFAPGFGYLVPAATDDTRLHVPRRDQPRTRVPAGAVGLAGEFSGIYPRASPGGWQLIGRTDADLFDAGREPAALLRPGVRVRFRQVQP